jgi:hypothetical protein
MDIHDIQFGLIVAGFVVIGLGLIHVIYPERVARFCTDHYRGKELIEELWQNQHIRPSFAKKLGFVIIGIGIWLVLSGLKIV